MSTYEQKRANAVRRAQNRAHGRTRPHARVRARPIHPGSSYKVTRRCLERRLFLTPGRNPAELANFIGYCIAYTANKYGIQIHAGVMMSNHYHLDVTDPHGQLVPWKQLLNSFIARGLNARLGPTKKYPRFDSFWSGDGPCDTRRPSDDETFNDLIYTITNPVSSALVKWSHLWPGFTTAGWKFGDKRVFKRPEWFFDKSEMPDEVSLTLVRPPVFEHLSDDELYTMLVVKVREKELELQAELRSQGRRFLGPKKLAVQSANKVPTSFEERFKQKPKVAASSKWRRLAQLQRDREWEREYAAARASWLAGESAVFPAGTYWLRRFAAVCVAQPPPS